MATQLSSQQIRGSVVSVKDYGAVGDGVTDDYQSFVDALAAARALGVPLYAPGTTNYYRLSAPLLLNENKDSFIGDGMDKTVLYIDHSGVGIKVTGRGWELRDFAIMGKSTSTDGIQIGDYAISGSSGGSRGFAENVSAVISMIFI